MKRVEPRTLKGFRDFLPQQAQKRQYVINTLRKVFESYGFEPLETPTLEYEDILGGKYGDEGTKLMYRFKDLGGRDVAMRYDLTVPLSRVVAQYQNELTFPFKRYQIQPVWRAENSQKGRYREFMQCDIDTAGTDSIFADAEVIAVMAKSLEALGFEEFEILLNDREVFSQLNQDGLVTEEKLPAVLRSLDKIKKIGDDGVVEDMVANGFTKDEAQGILTNAKTLKETPRVQTIRAMAGEMGVDTSRIVFAPYLARGLDYYTSTIFEVEVKGYEVGSIAGGGRYDNLVGMFAGKQIPAVGGSFGFDRLLEAMETLGLMPADLGTTKVLVTCFPEQEAASAALKTTELLRSKGINAQIYPDYKVKMDKQLKYADKKNIPYVVIIGPEEVKNNTVVLKNLSTKEQKTLSQDELVSALS